MPTLFLLMLVLLGPLVARAAVLTVPGQYPGIQAAMDASSPGDTVHVTPGTWYGLYTSPTHSLTLCSDYLFTQDSTDINETILDGEYAGTILDLICVNEWFTLCGFTLQHGMGQQISNGSMCHRAGALQINPLVHAEIRDIVFTGNRAPRAASILFQGEVCVGGSAIGNLILRNIACYNNLNEASTGSLSAAILIKSGFSNLMVDKLYYDGSGTVTRPFHASGPGRDSVYFNDIHIVNCLASQFVYTGSVTSPHGHWFTNLRSTDARGPNSCAFFLNPQVYGAGPSPTRIRNLVHSGLRNPFLDINTTGTIAEISDVTIERCRYDDPDATTASNLITTQTHGTLHNLHMHHNVNGDSVSAVAKSNLYIYNFNIDSAWVHDNRSTVPPHPSPHISGGNWVAGAMLSVLGDSSFHIRNLVFDNNRVDDLDDYFDTDPPDEYHQNIWREIGATAFSGTLTANSIRVRNSRQPNHCPEIGLSRPGSVIHLAAVSKVVADNIIIDDSDDGGLEMVADTVLASNIVLRHVGRMAIMSAARCFPNTFPYAHFSNILVENVDASDNYHSEADQHYSSQAVFYSDSCQPPNGIPPTLVFENITVTGCDDMRHLFSFNTIVNLHMRNCILYDNTYDYLVEWDLPITQNWEFNIVPEMVTGIGNQIGVDPWFEEELGVPWLSPSSPAIDAGKLGAVYNDREDPDNPGFALWPSQGTLRNDIGYTGGPYAGTLEHLVAVRKRVADPPTQPAAFTLLPAFPNPFNPSTTLSYTLARPMQVELSVYNLLGQQVRTLAFGLQGAGEHSVPFTAGELASGVYFVRLEAGGRAVTQKVVLIR